MNNSASISALSEWDRPGNDQTLAKLTEKQCEVLTEIETFMEGRRSFKEIHHPSRECLLNIGKASGSDISVCTPREKARDLEDSQSQESKSNVVSTSSNKGITSKSNVELRTRQDRIRPITTGKNFMQYLNKVEDHLEHCSDSETRAYVNRLENDLNRINALLDKVNVGRSHLSTLSEQYDFVSTKSNSLHSACQDLMAEQEKLSEMSDNVVQRLSYFTEADSIIEKLGLPSFSIHSESFSHALDKIDSCITFLHKKPNYVNSKGHIVKYQAALSRALGSVKEFVKNTLTYATMASSNAIQSDTVMNATDIKRNSGDSTFTLQFYGKFRVQAPKIENVIKQLERRVASPSNADEWETNDTNSKSNIDDIAGEDTLLSKEYLSALQDCQGIYFECRAQLLLPSIKATINKLCVEHERNHCGLMRSGCSLLLHLSDDEYRLYRQFFKIDVGSFKSFLDSICVILYDALRPLIINLSHLETLSELTSILKSEMLEYHCGDNPLHLVSFKDTMQQLLQDVQERLIFRTHIYIRTDIAEYKPHPGDLTYPEKLQMMESIQDTIMADEKDKRARTNSVSSNASMTSLEVASINRGSSPYSSPVDLHGMWYPTVRRTLVCLSRLYRCLELEIFQGLSQEVLDACIDSLESARSQITEKKGARNGQLFMIKHLLILREQITPFQVQLSVLEHSLDFSMLKNAALSLIPLNLSNKMEPQQLANLTASMAGKTTRGNSPLGLGSVRSLIEGTTPQVKEHCRDSRREVDKKLKLSCENFISTSVKELVGAMKELLDKVKLETASPSKISSLPWMSTKELNAVVSDSQKKIKKELPVIQKMLHLYLCNKETEFILFRPIRNEVMITFMSLRQIVNNEYTSDESLIIGCPSQEQVAMLLASLQIQQTSQPERNETSK